MSSNIITPLLTDAGLDALTSLNVNGIEGVISEVRIGDANGRGYSPQTTQMTLVNPRVKMPIVGGRKIALKQIQVTTGSLRAEDFLTAGDFTAREVGFYLQTGQLLAVWSHPVLELCGVAVGEDLSFSFNLSLERLPAGALSPVLQPPTIPDFSYEFALFTASIVTLTTRHIKTMDRIQALEAELERSRDFPIFLAAAQIRATISRMSSKKFRHF